MLFQVTFEKVLSVIFSNEISWQKLLNFLWELMFQFKIQCLGRRPELCEKFTWGGLAATTQCVFKLDLFKTCCEELWAVSIITAAL